ncbi:MAG: M48 family metallopeptidase [bacterium]
MRKRALLACSGIGIVWLLAVPFAQPQDFELPWRRPTARAASLLANAGGDGQTPAALERFFSREDMKKWKGYQHKKLWLHLSGLASVILFYAFFILLGLNRTLKRLALAAAQACYASEFLRRLGARFPRLGRLARLPERIYGDPEGLVVLSYTLVFVFILHLVFFPQSFLRTFWFEHRYGLSTYSLGLWLLDWAKGLATGTAVLGCMVFGIYGLLRRVGDKWWILLWAGLSAGVAGYAYVAPYRSHIYNDFRPLEPGELRDRLEELARRQEVPVQEILVVDASRRTRKVNAYFSGSGPSQRIVLYDTLLDQFTPGEITMILAHEIAHRKESGKVLSYVVFSITAFGILGLAGRTLKAGARLPRLHYESSRDVAGLPVLFLTFFLLFQALKPANSVWQRARELQADLESLEMVCDPEAFIRAHVKLAALNYSDVDPHPLIVWLFYSHPPFVERLRLAEAAGCTLE